MKTCLSAALLAAACLCAPARAADCTQLIASHATQAPDRLALPQLDYVGVEHSTDPSHPQFGDIERRWSAFRPAVAYFEGPNRPLPATREEVIRQTGESGFVRYLAQRDGIPFLTLEPSPMDELAHVSRLFPADQVGLFYTLREAARLRERMKLPPEQITVKIDELLRKIAAMKMEGFRSPFATSADVAAAYGKYWKTPANWWEAPQAWFDPARPSSATGGIFTNEINAESSRFRDLHMVATLADAARRGKVFAAVGRNHVMAQGAALRCALSVP